MLKFKYKKIEYRAWRDPSIHSLNCEICKKPIHEKPDDRYKFVGTMF